MKRYVASGAHLKIAFNGRRTIVHVALTRPKSGRHRRPNRQRPACRYLWVPSFDDVNTDGEAVMSARDEVLLRGLIDWVALERIHRRVARENAGEPLAVIQDEVLELIRSLVTDGLFELGDLATSDHRFGAWGTPLDESIQRIRDVYVNHFDDDPEWWFYCWLDPTEKGLKAARKPLKQAKIRRRTYNGVK